LLRLVVDYIKLAILIYFKLIKQQMSKRIIVHDIAADESPFERARQECSPQ
jgi:hypothetical protein